MSPPSNSHMSGQTFNGHLSPFATLSTDEPRRRFSLFDFLLAPFRDIDERAHNAPRAGKPAKAGAAVNGHAPTVNGHGSTVNGHGPAANGALPYANGNGSPANGLHPLLNGGVPAMNGHGREANGAGPLGNVSGPIRISVPRPLGR